MRVRSRMRPAFTLLEVILVMAVLVLLAALSYPSLESLYGHVQRDAGVDSVRAAWAEGQGRAVNEGRAYRFSLVPGRGNYRLAPDSAEFWSGGGREADDSDAPPFILEGAMPKGVTFESQWGSDEDDASAIPTGQVESSQWVTSAVFLPDGTARDDAEVVIQTRGVRPVTLRVRGLTGVVTTQR